LHSNIRNKIRLCLLNVIILLLSYHLVFSQDHQSDFRCDFDVVVLGELIDENLKFGIKPIPDKFSGNPIRKSDEIFGQILDWYLMYTDRQIEHLRYDNSKNQISSIGNSNAAINFCCIGIYPDANMAINRLLFKPANVNISNFFSLKDLLSDFVICNKDFFGYSNLNNLVLYIYNVWDDNQKLKSELKIKNITIRSELVFVLIDKSVKKLPVPLAQFKICDSVIFKETTIAESVNNYENEDTANEDIEKDRIVTITAATEEVQTQHEISLDTIQLYFTQTNTRDVNVGIDIETELILPELIDHLVFSASQESGLKILPDKFSYKGESLRRGLLFYPDTLNPLDITVGLDNYYFGEIKSQILSEGKKWITIYFSLKKWPVVVNMNYRDIVYNDSLSDYKLIFYESHLKKKLESFSNDTVELYDHENIKYRFELLNNKFTTDPEGIFLLNPDIFNNGLTLNLKAKSTNFSVLLQDIDGKHEYNTIFLEYFNIDLPRNFFLPDSLSDFWEVVDMDDAVLKESESEIESNRVVIPIKRKLADKTWFISFKGNFPPDEIEYEIYNNINKKRKTNTIDIYEETFKEFSFSFPLHPYKSDSAYLILYSPFGFCASVLDENPHYWDKSLKINLTEQDSVTVIWGPIPTFHVFYLDVSDAYEKSNVITLLKKKLKDVEVMNQEYVIFVSNSKSPLITADKKRALQFISQNYVEPPDASADKEYIRDYLPEMNRNIKLHYFLSESMLNYGKEEIINKLLLDIYRLAQEGNATNYSINKILPKIGSKINITIYCNSSNQYKLKEYEGINNISMEYY